MQPLLSPVPLSRTLRMSPEDLQFQKLSSEILPEIKIHFQTLQQTKDQRKVKEDKPLKLFLTKASSNVADILKKKNPGDVISSLEKDDPTGIAIASLFQTIVSTEGWFSSKTLRSIASSILKIITKEEKGKYALLTYEIIRKVDPFYERREVFVEDRAQTTLQSLPKDILSSVGQYVVQAGDTTLSKPENQAFFQTCKSMAKVKPLVLKGNKEAVFDIFAHFYFDTKKMPQATLKLLKSIGSHLETLPFRVSDSSSLAKCMELFPKLHTLALHNKEWFLEGFSIACKRAAHANMTLPITSFDPKERLKIAKLLGTKSLQGLEIRCSFFSDSEVKEALQQSEHIKELSLHASRQITDETLRYLQEKHPHIEKLTLVDIEKLTDAGFKQLANLSLLKTLKLYDARKHANAAHQITGETISQIAEKCEHIDTLELGLNQGSMNEIVPQLVKFPKLISLHLNMPHIEGRITDEHLTTISKLYSLTSLELGQCTATQDGLMQLHTLSHLQSLAIHGSSGWSISDVALSELLPQFPNLQKLHLSHVAFTEALQLAIAANPQLSELGVSFVAEKHLRFLSKLHSLKVLHLDTVSLSSLEKILQNMRFLKEIHIGTVEGEDKTSIAWKIQKNLINLQKQFPDIRLISHGRPIGDKIYLRREKYVSRFMKGGGAFIRAGMHIFWSKEFLITPAAILADSLLLEAGLHGSLLKNGTRKIVVWGSAMAASGFSPHFIITNALASLILSGIAKAVDYPDLY